MSTKKEIASLLKAHEFRVTTHRVEVLRFLSAQTKPVGIDKVQAHVSQVNQATLYRMMEAFIEAGIVKSYDVAHGHVDYEIATKPHHHHAVCESCGMIEEVYSCKNGCAFERKILDASEVLTKITAQSSTFFGICSSCAS